MHIHPYIHFNGECEAAFRFYEKALGGKLESLVPYSAAPQGAPVPPEWSGKVMNASLKTADGAMLFGCDAPPNLQKAPQGISIALMVADETAAKRVFEALSTHGKVTMPLQKTFWSPQFGMTTDQFGIHWMVNCAAGATTENG